MEGIKHLRRSASSRTPRFCLKLARVHWRPVPSAHRLTSRPGHTKDLVISQSCAVLSAVQHFARTMACWKPCCAGVHVVLAPSPAGYVPSGSQWVRGEQLADSGRARPGLYVYVITPYLINCFSARLDGRDIWVSRSRCVCQSGESGQSEIDRGVAHGHMPSIFAAGTCS
jgi:hypothetical protein